MSDKVDPNDQADVKGRASRHGDGGPVTPEGAAYAPATAAVADDPSVGLLRRTDELVARLTDAFPDNASIERSLDVASMNVPADELPAVALTLRDDPRFLMTQLSDLAGVDYATYGQDEWSTDSSNVASYSRAVDSAQVGRLSFGDDADLPERGFERFVVVTHLLSMEHNVRLRVRCPAPDDELPVVPSLVPVWNNVEWYEREAFDLFGILFDGHPDLRRLLTDYGFVGHPFRKDFPLIGNVEMRYDPVKGRVVYEPVTIEPRVLVPRVIRDDSRYAQGMGGDGIMNSNGLPRSTHRSTSRGAVQGDAKDAPGLVEPAEKDAA